MNNLRSSFAFLSVLVFAMLISPLAFGFSGGINGYSGNPATSGGASCTACHSGGAAPTVTLTGPNSVQPSSTSTYTLTISGGQSNAGGLDVSATGGGLVATQANTLLKAGELTHQLPATSVGGAAISWSFNWTAPAAAGNYTLYGAGISTNGDGITTGDNSATDALMVSVSTSAPQAPVAVIVAPKSAPTNTTVSFDGSQSTDADGTINQYAWNFGDNTTATGAQTVHSYSTAGVYTVTLTVTDDANLTDTTFVDITVGGQMVPVADAGGSYSGTAGQAISFDASNSTHVSAITRYLWDFGDGSVTETTTTPTTTHTYTNAGDYTLTLAVQDANFVTGVDTASVAVSAGSTPPPAPATGEELYVSKCQVCHGVGGTGASAGNIVGRSAAQINSAIANIPSMQSITLAAGDAQKMADFLATGTPPPPPPPSATGEELYIAKCQACHGVGGAGGSAGNIVGRSAAQINSAVANIPSMQFITLAAGDAQKMADFLATGTPPPPPPPATTGEEIYIAKCQGCHGVGGSGGSASNVVGKSANQITAAITNIPAMQSITLSAADAQAVAEFLATGTPPPTQPPPTTGEGIYDLKCGACHGPNGTGGSARAVIGTTAAQITAAIANVPAMQSISMTPGETQAVASFLATVARPTDGKGLYDMFCASCHGAEGKGGTEEAVVGDGYRSILEAINEEPDMQGLASALTNDEVRLIGNYLTSMKNGGGGDDDDDDDDDDDEKDSDMMRLQP